NHRPTAILKTASQRSVDRITGGGAVPAWTSIRAYPPGGKSRAAVPTGAAAVSEDEIYATGSRDGTDRPGHVQPALTVERGRAVTGHVVGRLLDPRLDLGGIPADDRHEQRRGARDVRGGHARALGAEDEQRRRAAPEQLRE